MVNVNIVEESALKRVLQIEIPADDVAGQLREMVEEYRKDVVIPGFRKGKAPLDMVKARVGESLESEYLRQALPRAYMEAIEESGLHPAADPEIKDLQFKPGEPLRFAAHIEIWPSVTLTEHRELPLAREEFEVTDDDVATEVETLRQSRATFEAVDRPAQGTDLVAVDYWVLDDAGNRGDQRDGVIEVGGQSTPEPFNQALMGAVKGESRKVVLPATTHTTAKGVHEHPEQVFELLIREVREKRLPPVDDALAKAALGTDTADLDGLRARIRLSLEAREMMRSRDALEETLFDELIRRHPFDVPDSAIRSALDDVVEAAGRERGGAVPAEDAEKLREYYRPAVERRLRKDLLIAAAGRQENVEVTDDEVEAEIGRFAEREKTTPAEVRGKLKKNGGLDRLRDDMYRHKVVETLLGLGRVDVIKKRRS